MSPIRIRARPTWRAEVRDDSKLAGMGDVHSELGILGATLDGGYAERCLVRASDCHPDARMDPQMFAAAMAYEMATVGGAAHTFYPRCQQAGEATIVRSGRPDKSKFPVL